MVLQLASTFNDKTMQTKSVLCATVALTCASVSPSPSIIPYPSLADSNSYALVTLFSPYPSAALCTSSCANIDRENVKWCVRIADPDRNIETCISLNGTEKVFESTCDAEPLDLEPYLSLPDVRPHTTFVQYMYMNT